MNLDQYISFVLQVIHSNVDPASGSVTAAKLGSLLLKASTVTWKQLGFRSLRDFLIILEQRQLIRLAENSKAALAVWLPDATVGTGSAIIDSRPNRAPSFTPLKKPFWVAFVVERPLGRRFFNRVSHEIRLGLRDGPTPVADWVEINSVGSDEQKEWAREFITEHKLEHRSELRAALAAPDWYQTFHSLLDLHAANLAKEWNRRRSDRVGRLIQLWCEKSSISPAVAFQGAGEVSLQSDQHMPSVPRGSGHAEVRNKMLQAIARMPTSELLEIPIPGKYLLDVGSTRDSIE